jgi:phospholipase D1/2
MVKWLVDGADYMESIAEAIELAQEEIFIASFFLSPELYLKRPVIHGNHYRLDYLLKRKAVSIFISLMSF